MGDSITAGVGASNPANNYPSQLQGLLGSGVTFLGSARRVDVTSDGVNLQVTTAADLPLPADGEVLLRFAPERAVALPGKAEVSNR